MMIVTDKTIARIRLRCSGMTAPISLLSAGEADAPYAWIGPSPDRFRAPDHSRSYPTGGTG